MFVMRTPIPYEKDKYNRQGNRNLYNTDRCGFNCAGYALEVFAWYMPVTRGNDCFGSWADSWDELNERVDIATAVMLHDFAYRGIRLIWSIEELQKDEYAFAFRVSTDGDFHYMKRGENGVWYEKRGSHPVIYSHPTHEVFDNDWNDRYDSRIVLFAIRHQL